MLELHRSTCDFIVPFYTRAQRYIAITTSLMKQGLIEPDMALVKIRTEIYGLHNQIFQLSLALDRKISRLGDQVTIAEKVTGSRAFFHD